MKSQKIRKTKRLWRLYKELRAKRRLCEELNKSNVQAHKQITNLLDRIDELEIKLRRKGHVLRFAVPRESVYLDPYARDICVNAHYAERRVTEISDAMKIQLVNDLLGKGYMKKCDVEPLMTIYELVIAEE